MAQENNEQSKNQLDVYVCLALRFHLEDPDSASNFRYGQWKMHYLAQMAQPLSPTICRSPRYSRAVYLTTGALDLLLFQDFDGSEAKECWKQPYEVPRSTECHQDTDFGCCIVHRLLDAKSALIFAV